MANNPVRPTRPVTAPITSAKPVPSTPSTSAATPVVNPRPSVHINTIPKRTVLGTTSAHPIKVTTAPVATPQVTQMPAIKTAPVVRKPPMTTGIKVVEPARPATTAPTTSSTTPGTKAATPTTPAVKKPVGMRGARSAAAVAAEAAAKAKFAGIPQVTVPTHTTPATTTPTPAAATPASTPTATPTATPTTTTPKTTTK